MPHFDSQGRDTAICQVCGTITHQVYWRPDISGHKSAGNVCGDCQRRHDDAHHNVARPVSLTEHCAQESGFPIGSQQLTQYINRYYGHG